MVSKTLILVLACYVFSSIEGKPHSDGVSYPRYLGCYSDDSSEFQVSAIIEDNSNSKCAKLCMGQKMFLSATKEEKCGCFRSQETMKKYKKSNLCDIRCPGLKGDGECTRGVDCCGGKDTFSVFVAGGLAHCTETKLQAAKSLGVDMTKTGLPNNCPKISAYSNDVEYVLRDDHMQYDGKCKNKPPTDEQQKLIDAGKFDWPVEDCGFNACCSPDCDWLLNYLEIDATVIKCID